MTSLGGPKWRASRAVRVMLQISADCELPDYVPDAEHFPFGLTTASVPANRLDDLVRHPGVRDVWLQSEERLDWKPRAQVMPTIELRVPVELVAQVAALLPELVAKGVRRLEVFRYSRPGEAPFWQAFVFDGDGRHVVGTPDQRQLVLDQQVSDLMSQLARWVPAAPHILPCDDQAK